MLVRLLKRELRQYRLRQGNVLDPVALDHVTMGGWALWPGPIRELNGKRWRS